MNRTALRGREHVGVKDEKGILGIMGLNVWKNVKKKLGETSFEKVSWPSHKGSEIGNSRQSAPGTARQGLLAQKDGNV